MIDSSNYFGSFDSLKKDFENNKQFVLFLGAGINLSDGVYDMSWNKLMDETFNSALHYCAYENNITSDEIKTIEEFSKIFQEDEIQKKLRPSDEKKDDKYAKYAKYASFLNTRDSFRTIFSPLVKATIVKQMIGNGYIPTIQQKIYNGCPKGFLEEKITESYNYNDTKVKVWNLEEKPFYTLYCLARIILLCDNIKAVVTQNYDNFLSRAVNTLLDNPDCFFEGKDADKINQRKEKNFRIVDISGMDDGQSLASGYLPIYHVHGYIPDDSQVIPEGGSSGIVLSMDEIYETTRDVFSWQTATQMHYFDNCACILAGLSFTDVTSQRMLYYVGRGGHKENIYYLDAFKEDSDGEMSSKAKKAFMAIRNNFLQKYGLSVLYSWEGFEDLYTCLLKNSSDIEKK